MKYCEFGLATKIVPCAALLWYFKNKVYSFFHWSRWIYLCFNTSLLIWNAEQIFMHKQCLYIPLFNCTESSKCTILVLIPRKSVHMSLVHWSIHPYALVQGNRATRQNSRGITFSCYCHDVSLKLYFRGVSFPHNSHMLGAFYSVLWTELATTGVRSQPHVNRSCLLN